MTLVLSILLPITTPPRARTVQVWELDKTEEQIKEELRTFLDKLDEDDYFMDDTTQGFSSHFTNNWSSPFYYHFFVGKISTRIPTTILRLETADGDGEAFRTMMIADGLLPPTATLPEEEHLDQETPGYRYHAPAQGLNLIAPWLAVLYAGESPRMSSEQKWIRFFSYLAADILVIGAGGTNGFRERFNYEEHKDLILGGLAMIRAVGAYQTFNLVRGHNRMVEMKYTFPVD